MIARWYSPQQAGNPVQTSHLRNKWERPGGDRRAGCLYKCDSDDNVRRNSSHVL